MSHDVPDGWRSTTLGEMADITGGSTPSKAEPMFWEGGTVPWATPSDVTRLPLGALALDGQVSSFVTAKAISQTSLRVLPVRSVLMTSRATIGFPAINSVPVTTNQGFANFLPNPSYDPDFLAQWIIHNRSILENAAGGSTFLEISKKTLRGLRIDLPPPAEQRRIAEILSSVDGAIQATQAVIEQTRNVKEGILERLLTKGVGHTRFEETEIGAIPEAWSVAKVEEVSEFVTSGSRGWSSYYADCGAAFIRIANLTRESIFLRPSNIQRVNLPENATEGVRTRLRSGDVLISITADLGIIGYIEDNSLGEAYVNQHIALVRPNFDRVHPGFLACSLQSKGAQKRFGILNDAGTKAGLNLPTIRRFRVPLPPISEQAQIFEIMRSFEISLATSIGSLDRLQATKSSLMADLLTGRRRVSANLPLAAE